MDLIGEFPGYKPSFKNGKIEDTNFLKQLNIKVGARVVLISNIDVSDSLVNGSTGTIVGMKCNGDKVSCIVAAFDDQNASEKQEKHPMAQEFIDQT